MKRTLVRLAGLTDREAIHRTFAGHFSSGRGRPALSHRLVAGLLYLQHAFDACDEGVVGTWMKNPYWQFFTGVTWWMATGQGTEECFKLLVGTGPSRP